MKEPRGTRLVALPIAEIVCCSPAVLLYVSIALSTQLGFTSQAPLGYVTKLNKSSSAHVHKLKAMYQQEFTVEKRTSSLRLAPIWRTCELMLQNT